MCLTIGQNSAPMLPTLSRDVGLIIEGVLDDKCLPILGGGATYWRQGRSRGAPIIGP